MRGVGFLKRNAHAALVVSLFTGAYITAYRRNCLLGEPVYIHSSDNIDTASQHQTVC